MKTVLITGVGRGIGKALAETFISEGWHVIGTVEHNDDLVQTEHLETCVLDLASEESIRTCVDLIRNKGIQLSAIINNAAVLLDEDETSVVRSKLERTLTINVIGTIDLTEGLLPLLAEGSHIVNVASSAGSLSLVGHESHHEGHYPSYKISKVAINMYTRTLALRLSPRTTVSSVHPGWTKTTMGGQNADHTPEEAARSIYTLTVSTPETGKFWYEGKEYPW